MQNAVCSSSICEPRTPAPAAFASIKPAKIDCCFLEMYWGKLAKRTHSFSQGKAKSPWHCCIYVKSSKYSLSLRAFGLEPHWEHLAGSRGTCFVAREKLFCFVSLPSTCGQEELLWCCGIKVFLEGKQSATCTLTWDWHRVVTYCRVWLKESQIQIALRR